jgi:hypothetical protein
MSLKGQSLPNLDVRDESVDPPIADKRRTNWHGRKVPEAGSAALPHDIGHLKIPEA